MSCVQENFDTTLGMTIMDYAGFVLIAYIYIYIHIYKYVPIQKYIYTHMYIYI